MQVWDIAAEDAIHPILLSRANRNPGSRDLRGISRHPGCKDGLELPSDVNVVQVWLLSYGYHPPSTTK